MEAKVKRLVSLAGAMPGGDLPGPTFRRRATSATDLQAATDFRSDLQAASVFRSDLQAASVCRPGTVSTR